MQDDSDLGQIPHAIDPPSELDETAHDLTNALQANETDLVVRLLVRRFQTAWNGAHRTPRLRIDGLYGTNTRSALASALGIAVASAPPVRSSPASTSRAAPRAATERATSTAPRTDAPRLTEGGLPVWLSPAVALAKWTTQARAADARASRTLAPLRTNAAWINARVRTNMHGVEVGQVPGAPSESDVDAWARQAWELAQQQGAAAQRALATHSEAIIASAERTLLSVRRALDRETDTAIRETLTIIENTLTAILRPVARGVREATRSLAGPAILIGVGLILISAGGRRAA